MVDTVYRDIYEEAASAVSSVESYMRYLQAEIATNTSVIADLQGEKGEKIAARRRLTMADDGACDHYDEGRPEYLSASDLRRDVEVKIYRLEKNLASAKEELVKKQAELERVQLLLAEEKSRLDAVVVEEEDGSEDLVF